MSDLKVNAGLGLPPSLIAQLQAEATRQGRSRSSLADGYIRAGLNRDAVARTLGAATVPENNQASYSPQGWYEELHGTDRDEPPAADD